jgi:hypothetical protein
MTRKKQEAQDLIDEHDERVRKQAEEDVIKTAKSLAGDPAMTGEVLLWLTQEMVEQGRLLRVTVANLGGFKRSDECALLHAGKMGKVALFGQTYKMPMTAAIICLFLTWALKRYA